MARPKKHLNDRRSVRLNLRLTAEEKAELDNRAAARDMDTADYVRRCALSWNSLQPNLKDRARTFGTTVLIEGIASFEELSCNAKDWDDVPMKKMLDLFEKIGQELNRRLTDGQRSPNISN